MLGLTVHILQHPETLKQLNALVVQLLKDLSQDKETILSFANLFASAVNDPVFLKSLTLLVNTLSTDVEFTRIMSTMLKNILNDSELQSTTKLVLMDSAQTVLRDDEIILRSKEFVTDVMADDTLQKEGGMAIFNSISHALKVHVIL